MIFTGIQPDALPPLFLAAGISGLLSGALHLSPGFQGRRKAGIMSGIGALSASAAAFLYFFVFGFLHGTEAGISRLVITALHTLTLSAFGILSLGFRSAAVSSARRLPPVLAAAVPALFALVAVNGIDGAGVLVLNTGLFALLLVSLGALYAPSPTAGPTGKSALLIIGLITAIIPLTGALISAAALLAGLSSLNSAFIQGNASLGLTALYMTASMPLWIYMNLHVFQPAAKDAAEKPEKAPKKPSEKPHPPGKDTELKQGQIRTGDQPREVSELVETQAYLNRLLNHDLNAPMGSLNNLLNEIAAQVGSGELPDYTTLQVMQDVSRRSIRLLAVISDIGKYQLHRALPSQEEILLTPLIWSSVAQFHEKGNEKDIEIVQDCDDSLTVFCDSYGLERVIQSLLQQGSAAAGEGGGIDLSSRPCPVIQGWVRIEVSYGDEPWPGEMRELVRRTPEKQAIGVDMNDRRLSLDMKLILTICAALGWGFSQENSEDGRVIFHLDVPGGAGRSAAGEDAE